MKSEFGGMNWYRHVKSYDLNELRKITKKTIKTNNHARWASNGTVSYTTVTTTPGITEKLNFICSSRFKRYII
jgi:hypothetical protein